MPNKETKAALVIFSCILLALSFFYFYQLYILYDYGHIIPFFANQTNSYVAQSQTYYCAPATVLMILKYANISSMPSQDELAREMNCSQEFSGIYISRVSLPFLYRDLRNFDMGSNANFGLALAKLRINLDENHPAILDIWFDSRHTVGHLVVAYGWNDSGIYIHDPWNYTFSTPGDGAFGPSTFLKNTDLESLWNCNQFWMFIYKSSGTTY
jgi:hypothetical protein